jgi:hypothetical protein
LRSSVVFSRSSADQRSHRSCKRSDSIRHEKSRDYLRERVRSTAFGNTPTKGRPLLKLLTTPM